MKSLLATIFVLLFSTFGYSEEVFFVVGDGDKATATYTEDPDTFKYIATQLDFDLQGTGIRTRFLSVSDLNQLADQFKAHLGADDTLRGVIFVGHGTRKTFRLNLKNRYAGDEIGPILANALQEIKYSESFFVHFFSCRSGNRLGKGPSVQDSFMNSFLPFLSSQVLKISNLDVLAHPFVTNWRAIGSDFLVDRLVYKTGLLHVMDYVMSIPYMIPKIPNLLRPVLAEFSIPLSMAVIGALLTPIMGYDHYRWAYGLAGMGLPLRFLPTFLSVQMVRVIKIRNGQLDNENAESFLSALVSNVICGNAMKNLNQE